MCVCVCVCVVFKFNDFKYVCRLGNLRPCVPDDDVPLEKGKCKVEDVGGSIGKNPKVTGICSVLGFQTD